VKNRLKLKPDEEWLDVLERNSSTKYSDAGSEESSEE
jgi:hypothetical protein